MIAASPAPSKTGALPTYKPEFLAHVAARQAALRTELAAILPAASAIVLEIGSGHGHFLVQYASEHPQKLCIGVDLIGERIVRAKKKATRTKLTNCYFIRAEAKELMALARAGKIKPTPMKEEPMADVQKWIDELRAGKVVGRIVLKN